MEQVKEKYAEKGLVNSGNFVIDTLINAKSNTIKSCNIKFDCNIVVPTEMDIDEADVCILLGNVLDNAMEAVSKAMRKEVELSIVYKKGKLTIGIRNTYSGEILEDRNKLFVSTKPDKMNHGMGMKLIKKVVEKYNGFLDVQYADQTFTLIAILYEKNYLIKRNKDKIYPLFSYCLLK